MTNPNAAHTASTTVELDEPAARLLAEALHRVKFGSITLTIHDGRVTEIDTTQRTRLPATR